MENGKLLKPFEGTHTHTSLLGLRPSPAPIFPRLRVFPFFFFALVKSTIKFIYKSQDGSSSACPAFPPTSFYLIDFSSRFFFFFCVIAVGFGKTSSVNGKVGVACANGENGAKMPSKCWQCSSTLTLQLT